MLCFYCYLASQYQNYTASHSRPEWPLAKLGLQVCSSGHSAELSDLSNCSVPCSDNQHHRDRPHLLALHVTDGLLANRRVFVIRESVSFSITCRVSGETLWAQISLHLLIPKICFSPLLLQPPLSLYCTVLSH